MIQELIAHTNNSNFVFKLNQQLSNGFRVIPGTTYAVALEDEKDHFFSMVLWKNNREIMLTSITFGAFVSQVNTYLNDGYLVVVGTLYACSLNISITIFDEEPKLFTQYFFNIIGKD